MIRQIDTAVLVVIEVAAAVATVILAVMWVRDADGNYEPWIVICGAVVVIVDIARRFRSDSRGKSTVPSKRDDLIVWIQQHGPDKPLNQVTLRALQLAQVIGDRKLEHWITLEVNGYTAEGGMVAGDEVPAYREIGGHDMNEHNQMVQFADPKLAFVHGYRLRNGVSELEAFADKTEMQNIRDTGRIKFFREKLGVDVVRFCFNPVEVFGVLSRIRNALLEKVNRL